MAFGQRLRTLANKVFGKEAANDNAGLQLGFTPTDAQKDRALNPPADATVELLHGVSVKDVFRPMEDIKSTETLDWVARQNKKFQDFVMPAKDAHDKTVNFLQAAEPTDAIETIPYKRGARSFFWRKNNGEARYTLLALKDGVESTILNPADIDPSGKTDVVAADVTRDGKMLAYALSVSGSDARTLKFRDLETGKDIDLEYKDFRSSVTWDRDGGGFHYTRPVENLNKSFEVVYHKMGTPVDSDKAIFTPTENEAWTGYSRTAQNSGETAGIYEWIHLSNTADTSKNAMLVRKTGSNEPFREIFPISEGILSPLREVGGKIYAHTTHKAPKGRVVAIDLDNPAPANWTEILPETADPLNSATLWQGKIFATYSHDTGEVGKVYDFSGKHLHDMPLPPLSTFTMEGYEVKDKTCFTVINNFQETGNIYKYDSDANTLTLHKKSIVPIDLKDCIVERLHAPSKDGTLVPMTVIRHPDTKLDGTAATLLYGYGGFNISLDPGFSAGIAEWVRAGGIYVSSNLRGGGEFGAEWYAQGCRDKKQNVFDDFAACAEYLAAQKYTSANRLAIQGGSNGGLLTLATALQRPELFGAVISEVPVTDMFRFHIGSYYGFSWKSDYGDPDIKADFNIAAKYSPLHNVKPDFKHPPVLIKTDIHDDRVQPWHGFKMAATLQSLENASSVTLLKTDTDGGHGAGKTMKQWNNSVADTRAFLVQALGPINQNDYKATLAKAAEVPVKKKSFWKFGG